MVSLIGLVVAVEQPGSAEPSDPFAALLERFHGIQTFSASFVEEKRIALLSEPLVNLGRIEYTRPRRLERTTTSPFESAWVLDGHQVTLDDGSDRTTIDLRKHPDADLLATAFMDVLEGDVDRLRHNFQIGFAAQRDDTPWKLELTPPKRAGRALFTRIEINGLGVRVQRLVIIETTGDRSTTSFSNVRIQQTADTDGAKEARDVQ